VSAQNTKIKWRSRLHLSLISCPVASVLYSKGKEEGRRKKEEERGKREEGYPRKKKPSFPVDIHPWVYTNDINGHDIT
uniref:hypothetical protein n=1 Tax=Okeania hirsuta TaxID=1458930 RepID=UPI001960F361